MRYLNQSQSLAKQNQSKRKLVTKTALFESVVVDQMIAITKPPYADPIECLFFFSQNLQKMSAFPKVVDISKRKPGKELN